MPERLRHKTSKKPFYINVLFVAWTLYNCTSQQALTQNHFFGTPIVRNYTTENFKGGIQSWGFTQDDQEILYIANNFGLLRFDGNTWSLYPVKNGTKVRSVLVGEQGNVYVGSQADFGYFAPDPMGRLQYFSLADSLPEVHRNFDEVWRIFKIGKQVFFLTFKNIYAYTPGTPLKVISPDDPLEFSFKVNNQLYSLAWGKGLSVLENESLRLVPGGEFFADIQIASVLPYDQKQLIIFTIQNGVYLYDGHNIQPFESENLHKLVINQAIMLKDGAFALGTQNKGLVIIDRNGNLVLQLSRDRGLLDQTVHTLYQDAHENLWLGLNSGISMIELSSPFSLIDENTGLAGTGYAALQVDKQLYLGTNNGLFTMALGTGNTAPTLQPIPNSTGQVYHLNYINEHILVGHHNGPLLIQNEEARLISDEKGAWIYKSAPGDPGKIVMGSYNGISLMSSDGTNIEYIKKFQNFKESSRVMEFDTEGNLWMAHGYKGIFKLEFEPGLEKISNVKFYNSKDGFPSDHLINMELINNKLIFPALYGIFVFDPAQERFVRDDEFSKLFYEDEHIVKMEEDILGNVYFISNMRIGRITFDKFRKGTIDYQIFNKIKDQLNDDLGTIHVLDGKNILFGAKRGFIHYNASKTKKLLPFHTHITKVINTSGEVDSLMLEGTGVSKSSLPDLDYKKNSLRFVYASPFFESPENTEYQYFLKGFDNGWSEWTHKVEKEYTNLPEGAYEFQVRAKNVYGTLSNAKSFPFVIHPPFYRSRVAYLIYSLSGILLLGFTFYQLDRRFTKEKNKLKIQQEQELSKKNNQIEQITSQSEQEIIRLRNEKLRSEIEHMNKELTSSTIHLINKNELLNSVKLALSDILRKKDKANSTEELKRIIKNIDQNITSDADWKHFELHFNHVHGNFTNRLLEKFPKLTPQEIKLSAYLRLNLNTKEIAHLLNISVRGVEISRYRLRKKLMLDRNDNLTDFMLKF